MAIDYNVLRSDLNSIYERLKPRELDLGAEGLRDFYAEKVLRYERARMDRQSASERFLNGTIVASVTASALGIGLIAVGPATVVAGASLALVGPAISAGLAIAHKLGVWSAEADHKRSRSLLDRSANAVLQAYNKDRQGGFLSRLYGTVADTVRRYETRAEKLIEQIDRLNVQPLERSGAVARILKAHVTPGFADYMHRSALDPRSAAAHLMERVSRHLDGSNAFDTFQQESGNSTLAIMRAPSHPGLNSVANRLPGEEYRRAAAAAVSPNTIEAPAVRIVEFADNVPKAVAVAASYGLLTATADDADFLRSLGIELGAYNDSTGQFSVKLDDAAKAALEPFEFAYPATLHALPAGLTDTESHVAIAPLSTFDTEALHAYRSSLQFEASKADGLGKGVLREAQVRADDENRQRVTAAREQIVRARVTEGSSLEM